MKTRSRVANVASITTAASPEGELNRRRDVPAREESQAVERVLPVHPIDEFVQVLDQGGDVALLEFAVEAFQSLRHEILDDDPILLVRGGRPEWGPAGRSTDNRAGWSRFNSLRQIICDLPDCRPCQLSQVAYPRHHRTTTAKCGAVRGAEV